MATALAYEPEAYPHIVKTPGVRAGKACIAGTRLAVVDIAIAHQQGHGPEDLRTLFSSRPLTLAEVYAALTYHYDHPEDLAQYLRDSERNEQEIETAKAEYIRREAER
jgi:uncharacterized protein (DUF433 family)